MVFEQTDRSKELLLQLDAFMQKHIFPLESEYQEHSLSNNWQEFSPIHLLKENARKEGLWNLFFAKEYGEFGVGLTNLEYALLAELMGRVLWSSKVFNCSAPDTGNMEVLVRYGTEAQKKEWLTPLLNGEIRSSFAMTEPDVASSDASNIQGLSLIHI